MEFAPLPLEKQIKGVNQNWLNWPLATSHCFKWWVPICTENVSPTTNISCSLIHFTTRSIAEKQVTGNEKNFWNCFGCSGDLGGSKYLLSQMTKNKQTNKQTEKNNKNKNKNKKRPTDPHKESRAKKEKGNCNKNLQDMCKNHQGLQQKKKRNLQNILSVGYSNYSWYLPDITRKP